MERLLTVEFGPSRSKRFPKAVAEARGGAGECAELERGRYRVHLEVEVEGRALRVAGVADEADHLAGLHVAAVHGQRRVGREVGVVELVSRPVAAELERGRYRVRFVLSKDAGVYTSLARLLQRVRAWRATDVYERDQLVSSYHAREMAWCASFQLTSFGDCRERFEYGVLPRCAVCPLFDSERAIRAGIREDPAPRQRLQIGFGQNDFDSGPEPDFTIVTDVDFLFDADMLAALGGEIPDWMNLSGLVPDFPPEEWGEPADEEPRS